MNSRQEQAESDTSGVRIAVDVGGTFTGLVVVDTDGKMRREKYGVVIDALNFEVDQQATQDLRNRFTSDHHE
ncbi:MAG: hypothetical protein CMJ81_03605 [Planctomycetaceae bacterium]|nr:hypothetical protein [Planctomycetaceae bacterium]